MSWWVLANNQMASNILVGLIGSYFSVILASILATNGTRTYFPQYLLVSEFLIWGTSYLQQTSAILV